VILESRIFAQAGMVSVQKNVLHGKRPQIVPLLSGEQSVRHADIEFFRACRYQLFTRGHQGCPGVEDIVNDHGAALHLSHRHVVHNSALGSMFFEANQIFRISSPRRTSLPGSAELRLGHGETKHPPFNGSVPRLSRNIAQGKRDSRGSGNNFLSCSLCRSTVHISSNPEAFKTAPGPSRSETLPWLQLILARVGKIREDGR
jgi:hypothetical protein